MFIGLVVNQKEAYICDSHQVNGKETRHFQITCSEHTNWKERLYILNLHLFFYVIRVAQICLRLVYRMLLVSLHYPFLSLLCSLMFISKSVKYHFLPVLLSSIQQRTIYIFFLNLIFNLFYSFQYYFNKTFNDFTSTQRFTRVSLEIRV